MSVRRAESKLEGIASTKVETKSRTTEAVGNSLMPKLEPDNSDSSSLGGGSLTGDANGTRKAKKKRKKKKKKRDKDQT